MRVDRCTGVWSRTLGRALAPVAIIGRLCKERTGTIHHSVICLTQRGSTRSVTYFAEPKFVPVDGKGKPSPPAPPHTEMVLPLLRQHFGDHVVLHMIDTTIKWSVAEEIPDRETSTVLTAITMRWFAVFGPPDVIEGDQEGALGSKEGGVWAAR